MRNLLTEVSKIKSMMGLKPNINEQSFFDNVNKIMGVKPNQNSDTFWDDVNKLTGISDKSQSGVVDGAKKMMKTLKPKSGPNPTGVSDKLVNFVANIEFFVKCVYDDAKGGKCVRKEPDCCLRGRTSSGTPTIGFGTVYYPDGTKVSPRDPDITETRAKELMKNTLNKNAKKILNLYPNLNQQQLDAMSSLCYQMGFDGCTKEAPNLSSSLKKNPNNLQDVRKNFIDFQFPDRREKEWKIYSQGIYS
jgi:GH24 family phage-related lysozyme (muramidase)